MHVSKRFLNKLSLNCFKNCTKTFSEEVSPTDPIGIFTKHLSRAQEFSHNISKRRYLKTICDTLKQPQDNIILKNFQIEEKFEVKELVWYNSNEKRLREIFQKFCFVEQQEGRV